MLVAVKQVNGALTEKAVLKLRGHPYIVRLYYAFQDHESLHMALDYMPGGDLWDRIEAEKGIPLDRARLYVAQVSLALAHLHDVLKVIYRDLKPENVLIDKQGHARLTDFGLAKTAERGKSFCGSEEYMAPEVVMGKDEHDKTVDWWGAGVLLHEMLCGSTPFCDDNPRNVLRKIAEEPITVSADLADDEARGIIVSLLEKDPKARLGAGSEGSQAVKTHAFFGPIDWKKLYDRGYSSSWIPPDPEQAAAEGQTKGGDGDSDEDGSGDIDAETDEESDDEWHMHVPGGGQQEGADDGYPDLFRGFTFRREQSMINPSSRASSKMTRSMTRRKRAESSASEAQSDTSLPE
uniref:Protein kinase domain-containing protein n=1 Tax=Haptolina ericina TaxID=156174 RepID=A0A7S3AFQ8_9EUKA